MQATCQSKSKLNKSGDVILVTGGNGFLGQHIVKILHEHGGDDVREIRIYDVKTYTKNLGWIGYEVNLIIASKKFFLQNLKIRSQ